MSVTAASKTDWRSEFFDFDDATYLNVAGQAPMPRVAIRAAQSAHDWKKQPYVMPETEMFALPNRIRVLLARLISGEPDEFAVTTGASDGLQTVAAGLDWRAGDEILIARGEFPAHFTTWLPVAERSGARVVVVEPRDRFFTEQDFIARITPRTRLVSVSHVRFGDGTRIHPAALAEACHAAGAYLLLDVSQSVGAVTMDVRATGADFLVASGYKWLLSPFGTGFFWIRKELLAQMRPAPYYWMALENAHQFHALSPDAWRPVNAARRWDAAETASHFNLVPMEASLEFVHRAGVQTVWDHNNALISQIIERLPRDRCLLASPADAERRGPYVCVAARTPEKTQALYEKLRAEKIFVSLREGALRIAPYLYNTEGDIDRLLGVLSV